MAMTTGCSARVLVYPSGISSHLISKSASFSSTTVAVIESVRSSRLGLSQMADGRVGEVNSTTRSVVLPIGGNERRDN